MLKSQLIEKLASQFLNISMHNVAEHVNLIIETMGDTLSSKNRIELRGFGSFTVRHYAPRKSRNPKTGKSLISVAKYRPHFKAGRELRKLVDS